jgi:hypothetical protein
MKYLENACEKENQCPEPMSTTTHVALDEDASQEANGVSSKETYWRMDDCNPRSENSVELRASQQSLRSSGSQVSDGSMEAGQFVFHAMDDLIEEHLKEVFPKPRLMARNTITPTKASYKAAVRDLLDKIHKRYSLLDSIMDMDTCQISLYP